MIIKHYYCLNSPRPSLKIKGGRKEKVDLKIKGGRKEKVDLKIKRGKQEVNLRKTGNT